MDTIFALSTARGKAGVAVVRVSGPGAETACRALCGDVPPARRAVLRTLAHGGTAIDRGLVLYFPGPASATGEDVAEFHVHGSPAVVAAILRVLGQLPGFRAAEPGEFTRRALEAGRMTLTEVEGLSDLLEAETEAQRLQAMRGFSGALLARAEGWRARLLRAAALIEATIDFVDEDVPVDVWPEVRSLVSSVLSECRAELALFPMAERLRDGFEVAIAGEPNAGKSTLLNRLAGREAAITSEIAGTTRDVIEVRMDLDGLPVTIIDTAGLRETTDPVEALGIERARKRVAAADLRIVLAVDGVVPAGLELREDDIVLAAKADDDPGLGAGVSGRTGAGVDHLLRRVSRVLARRVAAPALLTRERHRRAVQAAEGLLESVRIALEGDAVVSELVAEDIRAATRALESLIGRVDVEMVLGEIFARFCIGK
jgi:tRNA modification GTPase